MKVWLVAVTGARYEVLSYDKTTGLMRLKGKYAEIQQRMTPQELKQLGYKLVKEQ